MKMKWIASLMLFVAAAFAADITGNWKATAEGPNGSMERTFAFKVDGAKLTGETTSSYLGKSVIENGKIEGDNISFTITGKMQDNEVKVNYKGKVSGDSIKMTATIAGVEGQSFEWTAKKAK